MSKAYKNRRKTLRGLNLHVAGVHTLISSPSYCCLWTNSGTEGDLGPERHVICIVQTLRRILVSTR